MIDIHQRLARDLLNCDYVGLSEQKKSVIDLTLQATDAVTLVDHHASRTLLRCSVAGEPYNVGLTQRFTPRARRTKAAELDPRRRCSKVGSADPMATKIVLFQCSAA